MRAHPTLLLILLLLTTTTTPPTLAQSSFDLPELPECTNAVGEMALWELPLPPASSLPPSGVGGDVYFIAGFALTQHIVVVRYSVSPDAVNLPAASYVDMYWSANTSARTTDAPFDTMESLLDEPIFMANTLHLMGSAVLDPHTIVTVFRNDTSGTGSAIAIRAEYVLDPADPAGKPLSASLTLTNSLVLVADSSSGTPASDFFGRAGVVARMSDSRAIVLVSKDVGLGFIISHDIFVVEVTGTVLSILSGPYNIPDGVPPQTPPSLVYYGPYAPTMIRLGDISGGRYPDENRDSLPPYYLIGYYDSLTPLSQDPGYFGIIMHVPDPYTFNFPTSRTLLASEGGIGFVAPFYVTPDRVIYMVHAVSDSLDLSTMVLTTAPNVDGISNIGSAAPVLVSDVKTESFSAYTIGYGQVVVVGQVVATEQSFGFVVEISDFATNAIATKHLPNGFGGPGNEFTMIPPATPLLEAYVYANVPNPGELYPPSSFYFSAIIAPRDGSGRKATLIRGNMVYPDAVTPTEPLPLTFGVVGSIPIQLANLTSIPSTGCLAIPFGLASTPIEFTPSAHGGVVAIVPGVAGASSIFLHLLHPHRVFTIPLIVSGIPARMSPPSYKTLDSISVTPTNVTIAWPEVSNLNELNGEPVTYTLYVVRADPETGQVPFDQLSAENATILVSAVDVFEFTLDGLSPEESFGVAVEASTGVSSTPSPFAILKAATVCTAPGSFLPEDAALFGPCKFCTASEYVRIDPETGGRLCASCPSGSVGGVGAQAVTDCTCDIGFFPTPGASFSYECSLCPAGAECSGGGAAPLPIDGYYDVNGDGSNILPCPRPETCKYPGVCATGYTGAFCLACIEGFYTDVASGDCVECPSSSLSLLIVAIVGFCLIVLAGTVFIFRLSTFPWEASGGSSEISRESRVPHSISVGALFLQTLGVLRSVSNWPPIIARVLGVFQLLNFDSNIAASDCSITSFFSLYALGALVPVIALVLSTLTLTIMYFVPPFSGYVKTTRSAGSAGFVTYLKYGLERVLCVSTPLLYIGMAQSTLIFFDCSRSSSDGKFYLDRAPETECFDSDWWSMFPLALVMSFACLIGIPLYLSWILFTRVAHSVEDPLIIARFGSIFSVYRRPLYYYELVRLSKRLAVVVISLFFSSKLLLQCGLLLFVFQVFTLLQVRIHPYYRALYNSMELRLHIAISFVLVFAIIFTVDRFPNEASRVMFILAALGVIAFCVLSVILTAVVELREMVKRRNQKGGGGWVVADNEGGDEGTASVVTTSALGAGGGGAALGTITMNERERMFWNIFEREFDDIDDIDMKLRLMALYETHHPNPKPLS